MTKKSADDAVFGVIYPTIFEQEKLVGERLTLNLLGNMGRMAAARQIDRETAIQKVEDGYDKQAEYEATNPQFSKSTH